MRNRLSFFILLAASIPFSPLSASELPAAARPKAPSCKASGTVTPICNIQAPEDIELTPDGRALLISQTPGIVRHTTGTGLALLDLRTLQKRMVTPSTKFEPAWGDAACIAPPQVLAPHGIHLSHRPDGRWELLVVNHRGRESIEAYELTTEHGQYGLVWHGCVANPGAGMFNDVSATKTGFVATVAMERKPIRKPEEVAAALSGIDTGYLMEWSPAGGLAKLPQSEAPYNNGIQVSPDDRFIYFAAWTGKQVRKYDRQLHKVVATVALDFYPDNLTVRADGTYLVAGIKDISLWEPCFEAANDFCPSGFAVAKIDPATMRATPVYAAAPGLLPGASVGLEAGNALYIGTFTGDRILKVSIDK